MKLPALIALMVLAHTAFAGGRVALTLAAIRIGGSPLEVGVVVSLLAVVPMFLSVHAGRWTDRRGVFQPTLCALLAIEAGLLLAPVPSLAGMGASAVLLGSGFMLVYLAINNAVGHGSAPEDRHRAYSMLALGNSTSTVAGPVAAGFLIDLVGHAWTFLALAALPPLALAVLRKGRHAMAAIPAPARHAGKARMADLLRHAPLRAVFVVGVLLSMGWVLFTFMMPMHGERIGLSASAIGLVMGAFGGGTFFVRLFIPALAQVRRVAAPWWRTGSDRGDLPGVAVLPCLAPAVRIGLHARFGTRQRLADDDERHRTHCAARTQRRSDRDPFDADQCEPGAAAVEPWRARNGRGDADGVLDTCRAIGCRDHVDGRAAGQIGVPRYRYLS